MIRRLILFLIIVIASNDIQGQDRIGFACNYAGRPTKEVLLLDSLTHSMKYQKIQSLINSTNNSKQLLAIIICEILQDSGQINLTKKEQKQIDHAYISKNQIVICSGCTYNNKTTIENILNEIDLDGFGFNFKKMAIDRYSKIINETTNR